ALDLLCDVYTQLGYNRKKPTLLRAVAAAAKPALRAAAWQRLATVLADGGDLPAAWNAFTRAQRMDPSHPSLGVLEITLLASEGREQEAAARAEFWHAKLSRGPDAPASLLDFFAEAQRNPSAALTAGADSVADLDRFAMCLETQ